MAKTQEELIKYYENNLNKVISFWGGDKIRGEDYIVYARKMLEAVKKGGMEELIKFWNSNN